MAGSTPVQPATARQWLNKTGGVLCEGYGLTEASPVVVCNPVDAPAWTGSVVLPLLGTELRLLDDAGQTMSPGTAGDIALRGPQVMAGCWQRPEATARVMTADGFFRTGNIGLLADDGRLHLVERQRDTIFVSGFSTHPSEVDGVVTQIPGVGECAAVALHDAQAGEAVKLVVVKAPHQHPPGRSRCSRALRSPPDGLQASAGGAISRRPAEDGGRQAHAPGFAQAWVA